ncbi:ATP-binding cassette domain-containing protein [Streptomyces sp. NPDC059452]|uniref:ATP-binding cassette domain-containing protein n=1 Tax=Streptomyces sp. NPDC059452 TaxID=3346835 RepID=UPI00367FB647
MSAAVSVRDLRLTVGRRAVLDNLSLHLAGGRIYGLIGRNGSGRSSLMSVLAGLRRPDSGSVRIGGMPVFENEAAAGAVCLVRGRFHFPEELGRVRDALRFAAALRPGWDTDYARHLTERFRMDVDRRIRALSEGERAAVGVIAGLASRAPVTLFDEAHAVMDVPARHLFYDELLADCTAHPRTVIVSTHLLEELGSVFEEVVMIDAGKLVARGETEALRAQGCQVTGPADLVDFFVQGLQVLDERLLGRTKSAVVFGELDADRHARAGAMNLDLAPIGLQDLFGHLIRDTGEGRR